MSTKPEEKTISKCCECSSLRSEKHRGIILHNCGAVAFKSCEEVHNSDECKTAFSTAPRKISDIKIPINLNDTLSAPLLKISERERGRLNTTIINISNVKNKLHEKIEGLNNDVQGLENIIEIKKEVIDGMAGITEARNDKIRILEGIINSLKAGGGEHPSFIMSLVQDSIKNFPIDQKEIIRVIKKATTMSNYGFKL